MNPESHRYSRYFTYIKPLVKSPVVKTYGGSIFTIIALTVFILFAIKPTVETILVLDKKIEEYKQANEQVIKKSEDLTLARNNYKMLDNATRQKIHNTLPNRPDLRNLIQVLENTAAQNQASISALQILPLEIAAIQPNQILDKTTQVSFVYNLEGTYANLLKILTSLYQNTRIISINNLSIKKLENNNLFMSINGNAYYLK